MPQKNQIMLIKAFAKLHKDNPEYILKIYGEGQYRQELEMLIHNLNLDKCVYLPGSSTKIFDEIACAQLFVLSSNYEGMPNALIEAMCLGLPCISTKVSGATDLIQNNVNGILVEVGNEDELYNSMLRLIKTPELREKYASRATEINNKLEVNIIMKTWIEYLKQID